MGATKVAAMIADDLAVAGNGSRIKYVVLDACHQGDKRWDGWVAQ